MYIRPVCKIYGKRFSSGNHTVIRAAAVLFRREIFLQKRSKQPQNTPPDANGQRNLQAIFQRNLLAYLQR